MSINTTVRISSPSISLEAARYMKAVYDQGNKCKSLYDCEFEVSEKVFERLITLGLMEKVMVKADRTAQIVKLNETIASHRTDMKVKSLDIDAAATDLKNAIGMFPENPTPEDVKVLKDARERLEKVTFYPISTLISSINNKDYELSIERFSDIYYQVTPAGIQLLNTGSITISI